MRTFHFFAENQTDYTRRVLLFVLNRHANECHSNVHLGVCIWVFAFRCFNLDVSIWMFAFGCLHLDVCIWMFAFGYLHLNVSIWMFAFDYRNVKF